MGWVGLRDMAQVGANYAALHQDTWPATTTQQLASRQKYNDLINASKSTIDCAPVLAAGRYPDPVFSATRDPGQPVTVSLSCNFTLLSPFLSAFLSNPVIVGSASVMPITNGCVANCGSSGPNPSSTPGTAADNCRIVPTMVDISVAGARNRWVAAGFLAANFHAPSGSDSRTVAAQSITVPPDADTCPAGKAFVFASVSVTVTDLVVPKPTATCVYVPNMLGMTVAAGRSEWATQFTGVFAPATGQDAQIIDAQLTVPASSPGDCVEPAATVDVTYSAPPPPPPPAPCLVPSLVNTASATAISTWTGQGFIAANLTFKHRIPYTIRSQSLVGNTYWPCSSSMQVDDR